MTFGFHVSQSWRLFRRRLGSGFRILFVSAIATIGSAVAVAGFYANMSDISSLSEQIVITAFVEMETDSIDVLYIREQMTLLPEVEAVSIVYPEQARKEFTELYGAPTENLLPDNPFPVTLTATLHSDFRTPLGVQSAVNKSKRIPFVEDAVYRSSFVSAVEVRSRQSATFAVAAGCVILVVFFFVLQHTIRSSIGLTRKEAEVLTLTGAKRSFIVAPYILFGFAMITLGVLVGLSGSIGLYYFLTPSLEWLAIIPQEIVLISSVVTFGTALLICIFASYQTAQA